MFSLMRCLVNQRHMALSETLETQSGATWMTKSHHISLLSPLVAQFQLHQNNQPVEIKFFLLIPWHWGTQAQPWPLCPVPIPLSSPNGRQIGLRQHMGLTFLLHSREWKIMLPRVIRSRYRKSRGQPGGAYGIVLRLSNKNWSNLNQYNFFFLSK